MSKEIKNLDVVENKNVLLYDELLTKFRIMFDRIENMENLLDHHKRNLPDFSNTVPEQNLKLIPRSMNNEENPHGGFLEIKCGSNCPERTFNEISMFRDVSGMQEDVSNIKQHLQIFSKNDSEIYKRLASIENHLFKLFGENTNHFSIYELIDLVVEMNKSLENLTEVVASSKSQLCVFRSQEECLRREVARHKDTLALYSNRLDLADQNMEYIRLKQISDLEQISGKTDTIEDEIAGMKAGRKELIGGKEERGFNIETPAGYEEAHRGSLEQQRRHGGHRLLASWFRKQ